MTQVHLTDLGQNIKQTRTKLSSKSIVSKKKKQAKKLFREHRNVQFQRVVSVYLLELGDGGGIPSRPELKLIG
jgi:hypothetical protein